MVKEVKYQNQEWGEPLTGERLSTNGNYTGQHLGTPMQDKLGDSLTNKNTYWVEENTHRLGTMTQDTPSSVPEVAPGAAAAPAKSK